MANAIEYALMAGRDAINDFPVPAGWIDNVDFRQRKSSGFEATYFTNGCEIVISYVGTGPPTPARLPR